MVWVPLSPVQESRVPARGSANCFFQFATKTICFLLIIRSGKRYVKATGTLFRAFAGICGQFFAHPIRCIRFFPDFFRFLAYWALSAGKYIKPGLRPDNRLAFCKIFLLRLFRADNTGSRFPSAVFYHKMLRPARAKFHMFLFDGISLP